MYSSEFTKLQQNVKNITSCQVQ